jgi:acetyl-CoA carboxylase biotin carboxylase subunit
VAKKSGADAIHPGYGFLAENGEFARRCQENGIVFVGPPAEVIELMGDKVKARAIMSAAGIPVIPGSAGVLNSEEEVLQATKVIGYPFMLKAVAGGGGKGLRLVRFPREIPSAYRAVRSEATSFFGDPRLYLERYLERPRHVEIQILADQYGKVVHLYDRECSIQRRHQKIIEECPAPALDYRMRRNLGRIAIQGTRAVRYSGVGTLEFLMDREGHFYFLEMNTRLQVEHAVTERVVGIDLVKAQIEVAAGGHLPWRQRHITPTGHAIECRIYAEDPENDFMPCPGKIEGLRLPEGLGVRNDCGVYEGAEVPIYYDPMIAKLITWGENRVEAILRMRRALREYQVRGIKTNIPFHHWILRHPRFMAGNFDTGFIDDEYRFMRKEELYPHKDIALASAAIAALDREQERALRLLEKGAAEKSLWRERGRRDSLRLVSGFSGRGWGR